jgi:hypothetical protein
VSAVDAITELREAAGFVEARMGVMERNLQDLDAELAGCDDAKECAAIAARRMSVAFELHDVATLVRGALASLTLAAGEERQPGLRRVA